MTMCFDEVGYREPEVAALLSNSAAAIVSLFDLKADLDSSPELWDNLRDILADLIVEVRRKKRKPVSNGNWHRGPKEIRH